MKARLADQTERLPAQPQPQQQPPPPPSYFRPEVAAAARESVPLSAARVALLLIDVQHYNLHPDGAVWASRQRREDEAAVNDDHAASSSSSFFARVDACVPQWRLLLDAARRSGAEPLFTVIQSLTRDGRDRGLDYKLSGMHVAPGSPDARVLDAVGPVGADEIVLKKSSSSPFASTPLEYLLRSLGKDQLVVCGALTDQCVSSTVREAADRGFRVTVCSDACVGSTGEKHTAALEHVSGYCRVRTSAQVADELLGSTKGAGQRQRPS
jgi:ureidoacrylate peracid hydrolase